MKTFLARKTHLAGSIASAAVDYMIAAVITTPAVAVIVPTHNRIELLPKVLNSILAQTVSSEIYVMDDGSSDGTEAMVRRDFPQIHFYREEIPKGPTFQRNKGVEQTQAEFLF